MKNLRLYLFPALFGGIFSLAHAGEGTDPRDFNSYYAPAYRLPDSAAMPSSAARGKELIGAATDDPSKPPMFSRAQHTFGPFQPIEEALKNARNARGFS